MARESSNGMRSPWVVILLMIWSLLVVVIVVEKCVFPAIICEHPSPGESRYCKEWRSSVWIRFYAEALRRAAEP
jgi:hypothetical protein